MAATLFKSKNEDDWFDAVSCYLDRLEAKDQKKRGEDFLPVLDSWLRCELRFSVRQRRPPYLEKKELEKLMVWKLKRGKFRPRLAQLIASNSEEEVKSTTEEALGLFRSDPSKSLSVLTKLKGVGPATASAILAVFSEDYAFMSDEALEASGKVEYTPAACKRILEALQRKAEELGEDWTAEKVEMALWSAGVAAKLNGSTRRSTSAKETEGKKQPQKRKPKEEQATVPEEKQRNTRASKKRKN